MLGRALSLPLGRASGRGQGREVVVTGDLPVTPDPRRELRWAIAGLALIALPVVLLTAEPHLGRGITYADAVALTLTFTGFALLAIRVPWHRVADTWLLVLVGVPIVFVAALNSLTGAGASPYFAMYAPILAIAGWYLTGRQAALATGLMIATEIWRAVALDRSGSLDHLTIALPFDIAIAGIAHLTSRWLRGALIETRQNQVRMAATLDAVRLFGSNPSLGVLDQLERAAGAVFDARASIIPFAGRRPAGEDLAGALVANGGTTVIVPGAHRLHAILRLEPRGDMSLHDLRLAGILAEAAGRTLDAGETLDQVRSMSEHDALTGLFNRGALDRDLDARLGTGDGNDGLGLLFIDLDGFKGLNDAYGHVTGDAVLVRIAGLLRGVARERDRVYRFGGDEFALLLDSGGMAEARRVAERILQLATVSGRRTGDTPVAVRLSIGIAVADRDTVASTLLMAADEAMYAAKNAGGGVIREGAG